MNTNRYYVKVVPYPTGDNLASDYDSREVWGDDEGFMPWDEAVAHADYTALNIVADEGGNDYASRQWRDTMNGYRVIGADGVVADVLILAEGQDVRDWLDTIIATRYYVRDGQYDSRVECGGTFDTYTEALEDAIGQLASYARLYGRSVRFTTLNQWDTRVWINNHTTHTVSILPYVEGR